MGEGLKSTLMSAALGPLEAINDIGWAITGVLGECWTGSAHLRHVSNKCEYFMSS